MKLTILISALIATYSVFAAQTVTLSNGKKIKLNNDFTWQYIETNKIKSGKKFIETIPITKIPIKITTIIKPNSHKNTLQLSDSGVEILLGKATYKHKELIIPTTLTNQSSSSIIAVYITYELYDMKGKPLAVDNKAIWQSVKRMASTYLRPKESKLGRELNIKLPKLTQYQILAKISNVESR